MDSYSGSVCFVVFSVTMWSAVVDGDSMDHLLIFSITTSSATADDDSMDLFQVFYVTLRSAATDGNSMTILWSFLSHHEVWSILSS